MLVILQQPLARQLDLARGLAGLEATPGGAYAAALGELELFLVGIPGAGAVVREVDAGEGVGAEVVVADGWCLLASCLQAPCSPPVPDFRTAFPRRFWGGTLVGWWKGRTLLVAGLVEGRVAGVVLGLVVLLMMVLVALVAAAEHLVEEAELGGGEGEEREEGEEEVHIGCTLRRKRNFNAECQPQWLKSRDR